MFPIIALAAVGFAAILQGCSRKSEPSPQKSEPNPQSSEPLPPEFAPDPDQPEPAWCSKVQDRFSNIPAGKDYKLSNAQAEADCGITPRTGDYESRYLNCSEELLQKGKLLEAYSILRSLKVNSTNWDLSREAFRRIRRINHDSLGCPNQGRDLPTLLYDKVFDHTKRSAKP